MIYETKRNIGDMVWVPRVFNEVSDDVKVIDGKEYTHTSITLNPVAKQKMIVEVIVSFTYKGIEETYMTINAVGANLADYISNKDKGLYFFPTEHEALDFAIKWMETENRTFYG